MFSAIRSRVIEYIILANALMFIAQLAYGRAASEYFALTPAYVFQMPWTILTSMFMHAGFEHILMNMFFGVFMFGSYLQQIIGEREFTNVYFLGGLAASLFYVAVSLVFGLPNPLVSAVGASGAVFAIVGALIVLQPNMKIYLYFLFPMPLWVFGLLYMLYSIVAIPTQLSGGTAVTAHVGGLVAGLMMGKLLQRPPEQPKYTYVRYY
ncbi:MAG: rhomboid family intramembrane serine protease [Candidatus Altiarchaeota archaeon]